PILLRKRRRRQAIRFIDRVVTPDAAGVGARSHDSAERRSRAGTGFLVRRARWHDHCRPTGDDGERGTTTHHTTGKGSIMTTTTESYVATEAESREIAEQARQAEWEGKGFLRELFLGKLQLDLIHPFPAGREERPHFKKFYEELRWFLIDHVDPAA